MMRKLFLCLFALAFLCSCAQEVQKEKIPFTFTPERKLISVPVTIQGVTGNFLFDTGVYFLGLDTTFAAKIAPYDSIRNQQKGHSSSDYASWNKSPVNIYEGLLNVEIGSHNFDVEKFRVGDFHDFLQIPEFDGIFGLKDFNPRYVWEVNFEENYISIIPSDSFHIDEDFLTLPLRLDEYGFTFTTLPVAIRTKQGVEVKSEEEYLIDTGSYTDILFLNNTEEAKKLNTKNNSAYWLHDYHFWEGEIYVCGRVKLDSARVYVYDFPLSNSKRSLGMNFFKRFNVFFDMKNRLLYLKPIKKKFERIKWLKRPWGKFSSSLKNGKDIIDRICDYKENPAIKAGFQVGDEIISINGKLNSEYSEEDWEKLSKEEIWNYVIKRDGKLLNLTLHRNLDKQIED